MAELLILSVAGSESECSVVVEKTTPEEASEASEIAVEGVPLPSFAIHNGGTDGRADGRGVTPD